MNILYFTYPLDGLLMIAIPIALAIYLTRKFQLGWRLWWIGGATFVLSQVGHIPFNQALTNLFQQGILPAPPTAWRLPFNAVVLGLSAGLWEELARYAMYRWWAKDARSWRKGLLVGAGHGGAEAIILGGLVLYGFIQMVAVRGADLSTLVAPNQLAQAQAQVAAYWSAPWYYTLLGAVERAFTLVVQISLAVLVLQVFTRHQSRWLWMAIGWHTVVDAVGVFSVGTWNVYVTEGIIGVMALISLGIIFALRQPEPEAPSALESSLPVESPSGFMPKPIEETPDNLESTRYN